MSTPVPTPRPTAKRAALLQRPAARATPLRDRALSLVGGVWSCATKTGDPAKHVYTIKRDGTIKLHNELVIAKRIFAVDELYRFDKTTGRWSTATQGNAYLGVAPPWQTSEWIFEGSVPHGNSRLPVRMVYVSRGNNVFERDFQRYENGDWKSFTTETCRRR